MTQVASEPIERGHGDQIELTSTCVRQQRIESWPPLAGTGNRRIAELGNDQPASTRRMLAQRAQLVFRRLIGTADAGVNGDALRTGSRFADLLRGAIGDLPLVVELSGIGEREIVLVADDHVIEDADAEDVTRRNEPCGDRVIRRRRGVAPGCVPVRRSTTGRHLGVPLARKDKPHVERRIPRQRPASDRRRGTRTNPHVAGFPRNLLYTRIEPTERRLSRDARARSAIVEIYLSRFRFRFDGVYEDDLTKEVAITNHTGSTTLEVNMPSQRDGRYIVFLEGWVDGVHVVDNQILLVVGATTPGYKEI